MRGGNSYELLSYTTQNMTTTIRNKSFVVLTCSLLFVLLFGANAWAQNNNTSYVIDAESMHIGTGEILSNGRILVKNGIIEAVGSQSK